MKPAILVVDDDVAVCELLQDVLSEHVFTVLTCHSGQDAVNRIQQDSGIALVLLITAILDKFHNNIYVEGAFYGLRPASVGLITAAGVLVVKISLLNVDLFHQTNAIADLFQWKAVALAALLLVLTRYIKKTKGLHPVYFIVFSAVIGILFGFAGV